MYSQSVASLLGPVWDGAKLCGQSEASLGHHSGASLGLVWGEASLGTVYLFGWPVWGQSGAMPVWGQSGAMPVWLASLGRASLGRVC